MAGTVQVIAAWGIFDNPTLQAICLGTTMLGVVSGILGTFAVLRRQSLLGDAISHSALPGIALAFLFVGKQPLWFVLGAAFSGWLSTLAVLAITRNTRLSFDAALAGTLAAFFGLGLTLMSYVKKHVPGSAEAGLEKYLFGQAATMLEADRWIIFVFGIVAGLILLLFWKEIQLVCFDPEYAATRGYPVRLIDTLMMVLLVGAIVIGLQAVGVVLMSALIVAPAAAARQWSDRLANVTLLAGLFGGLSGLIGTIVGDELGAPTGPSIVLCATAFVVLSLPISRLIVRRS